MDGTATRCWNIAARAAHGAFAAAAQQAGFAFVAATSAADMLVGTLNPTDTQRAGDPLPSLLALPLHHCVESESDYADIGDSILVLTITTRTCFDCDPGTAFTRALCQRDAIAASRQDDLRLCLHEAIANGVMHGNLELESSKTAQHFAEQAVLLQQRLGDPLFAARRLTIGAKSDDQTLTLWVSDDGKGFDPAPNEGRGLSLIETHCDGSWHSDVGNQIFIQFRAGSGATIIG